MAEETLMDQGTSQDDPGGRPGYSGPRALPGEKTLVKDISWCGVAYGCGSSCVDVKDNKIIRIRPLHYDWKYSKEQIKPWVMNARGKTFEPKMTVDLHPYHRLQEAGVLAGAYPLPHEAGRLSRGRPGSPG